MNIFFLKYFKLLIFSWCFLSLNSCHRKTFQESLSDLLQSLNTKEINPDTLKSIPLFSGPGKIFTQHLHSGTNDVYKVTYEGRPFIVRIPGDETKDYINRKIESFNLKVAAHICTIPKVEYFDEKTGIMVQNFISHTSAAQVGKNELYSLAHLLKKLHNSPKKFYSIVSAHNIIESIDKKINQQGGNIFLEHKEFTEAIIKTEKIMQAYQQIVKNLKLSPCHNDLHLDNILVSDTVFIIDWELAGNNDPAWDLACLIVNCKLTSEQELYLYNQYKADPALLKRVEILKPIVHLLAAKWLYLKEIIVSSEFKYSFHVLTNERLKNLRELVS